MFWAHESKCLNQCNKRPQDWNALQESTSEMAVIASVTSRKHDSIELNWDNISYACFQNLQDDQNDGNTSDYSNGIRLNWQGED